jgi:hypothetical protein
MLLKLAWATTLFAVGLARTGSWEKAILDQWSVQCTLLPHPAPYPYELRRLANGEPSWHGVKQLFTCAPDPEWQAFFSELRAREAASPYNQSNRNSRGSGLIRKLQVGDH